MKTSVWACLAVVVLGGCGDQEEALDLAAAADMAVSDDLALDLSTASDLAQPADLLTACDPDGGVPSNLVCTGLYADWGNKTVAADVRPFAPGHQGWSDGAAKSRYIQLPPGTQIDVSAMNDWVFPVGTKLWKEFRLTINSVEKRIETRLYWKRGAGDWVPVVYRWNDAETDAPRLTGGEAMVGGTTYEVPAENKCASCHHGKTDKPLGFEAVLLAAPAATGLTYAQLQAQSLLTSSNNNHTTVMAATLQIPGVTTEQAALGYLHANCGVSCHKVGGPGPFYMDIDVGADGTAPTMVSGTNAYAAINFASAHVLASPPIVGASYYRLRPTDNMRSMVRLRMNIRDADPSTVGQSGLDQMPPSVTHKVDTTGLGLVDGWINYMTTGNGYPSPAAP